MPFVGKDLKTLEFQKQRQLEELRQKTKNRIYYKKNKEHIKDTGSSLIAPKEEKTTLEQYLDASKVDINIEDYLVKELGANRGQSKVFIQSLDENLKKYLLDRLPAFKKVFNDNFTIPSSINLKSAFELFNRQQIEKTKDVDIPSRADLEDYLENLNRPRLYDLGLPIYIEDMRKSVRMSPSVATRRFNNDYDYLSGEDNPEEQTRILVRDVIINYITTFENPIDGWMATNQVARSVGLMDFPKPQLKENRADLTSTIRTPISEFDLETRSSDFSINTPRSSLTESSNDFITPRRDLPESPSSSDFTTPRRDLPESPSGSGSDDTARERARQTAQDIVERARERARRRIQEGEGLGYNTPGLVKIYKLKK